MGEEKLRKNLIQETCPDRARYVESANVTPRTQRWIIQKVGNSLVVTGYSMTQYTLKNFKVLMIPEKSLCFRRGGKGEISKYNKHKHDVYPLKYKMNQT